MARAHLVAAAIGMAEERRGHRAASPLEEAAMPRRGEAKDGGRVIDVVVMSSPHTPGAYTLSAVRISLLS
jgi:hypothetical protein